MPLKNMKIKKSEMSGEVSHLDEKKEHYPYGLSINIDKDSYEKLGLADVPTVGDMFTLLAKAKVRSVHLSSHESSEKDINIHLQITDMALEQPDDEAVKDAGEVLYGGSSS